MPHASREWFHALDERYFAAGQSGDFGRAMAILGELMTTVPAPGAEVEQVSCVARSAILAVRFGPPDVVTPMLAQVEVLAAKVALDVGGDRRVNTLRAFAARARGDADASFAGHAAALAACDTDHNLRERAFTCLSYGGSYDELGVPARAAPLLDEGIAIADRIGADTVLGLLHMSRALTRLGLGDRAGSRADAERAIASGDPGAAGISQFLLASLFLDSGELDDALAIVEVAVAGLAGFGEYGAMALSTRARIRARRGDLDGARADVAASKLGMRRHDGFQFGESLIRYAEIEVLELAGAPEAAAARAEAVARLRWRASRIVEPWRTSFLARPENALTLAGA